MCVCVGEGREEKINMDGYVDGIECDRGKLILMVHKYYEDPFSEKKTFDFQ